MAVVSGLAVSADRPASRSVMALSLPLMLGVVLFICLANAGGLPLLGDPDSQWHIGVGHWMLAHRTVPDVDTFSFTFAGQPWIAKEWLSQLLLTGAFDVAGWAGVELLAAAAVAASFALLLRLLLRDLKPLPALLFTGAALVMMAPHFLARPHVLAFPFMLLWVAGLVRAVEERRAPQPVLLLAMLLWANMHGGFTLGLLLAGAFALEALVGARDVAERKALFFAWLKFGIGAGLVACITPYGWESILVTSRIFSLGGDALNMIAEWRSPDFKNQPTQEIVLLLALYLAFSRGLKLPLLRLLVVLGLVHLYLSYARNAELLATLAALAVAPVLVRQFPSLKADPDAAPPGLAGRLARLAAPAGQGAELLGLLALTLFAAALIRFADVRPPGETMPQAALTFAETEGLTKQRVFNHYNFGGYLIGQGVPTFIDGRGELYGGEFIKRYSEAVNLRGEAGKLEDMLEHYKVEWTFLTKDAAANKLLAHLPGWRQVYGDDQAIIFVKARSLR
jgi:hypothetical protein